MKIITIILSLIVLPFLAILCHFVLFAGIDKPPTDHGTGSMFDLIADRYDMINRVLAINMDIGWRQDMVERIRDSLNDKQQQTDEASSPRILDVSTGTADVAILLALDMPKASVIGIDPSSKMLQVGLEKVKQQSLQSRVELRELDARNLSSLSEASFDAATMAFGIRNVPERPVALCEIHRLLKDKSRFCIMEFSEPDDSFGNLAVVARFFIRHIVPFLGGLLSGRPREYWHLQNSIKDFPSPADFANEINGLTCDTGTFAVGQIQHLSFGSVQIYNIAIKRRQKEPEPPSENGDLESQ